MTYFARLLSLLLGVSVLLAGCLGGEPSESDMAQALHSNDRFRISLGALAMLDNATRRNPDAAVANMLKAGVVEKASCVAAQGTPGYVCDFRWGQKLPDGSVRYGNPAKARFYKVNDSWAVDV